MKGEAAIVKDRKQSEPFITAYAVTNARSVHIPSRNSLHCAVLSNHTDSVTAVVRRLPGLALETVVYRSLLSLLLPM